MFGPKKDVGRPTKFTPERRAAIVDAISHRIPYEYAAEANGICEDTLYEWLKIAREHRKEGLVTEYTLFSEAIKRAEMTRIREHCDMIAAKPERWQADAWILERRWYKHFGPNAQLNELNEKLSRLVDGEPNEIKRNEEDGKEGGEGHAQET
jgi:transposase-like protein